MYRVEDLPGQAGASLSPGSVTQTTDAGARGRAGRVDLLWPSARERETEREREREWSESGSR